MRWATSIAILLVDGLHCLSSWTLVLLLPISLGDGILLGLRAASIWTTSCRVGQRSWSSDCLWFIAPCPRELRHRASKTHTGCRLSLVTQGEGRDPQWTFNIRNQLTLV